jgi:hypothetical protein
MIVAMELLAFSNLGSRKQRAVTSSEPNWEV